MRTRTAISNAPNGQAAHARRAGRTRRSASRTPRRRRPRTRRTGAGRGARARTTGAATGRTAASRPCSTAGTARGSGRPSVQRANPGSRAAFHRQTTPATHARTAIPRHHVDRAACWRTSRGRRRRRWHAMNQRLSQSAGRAELKRKNSHQPVGAASANGRFTTIQDPAAAHARCDAPVGLARAEPAGDERDHQQRGIELRGGAEAEQHARPDVASVAGTRASPPSRRRPRAGPSS